MNPGNLIFWYRCYKELLEAWQEVWFEHKSGEKIASETWRWEGRGEAKRPGSVGVWGTLRYYFLDSPARKGLPTLGKLPRKVKIERDQFAGWLRDGIEYVGQEVRSESIPAQVPVLWRDGRPCVPETLEELREILNKLKDRLAEPPELADLMS